MKKKNAQYYARIAKRAIEKITLLESRKTIKPVKKSFKESSEDLITVEVDFYGHNNETGLLDAKRYGITIKDAPHDNALATGTRENLIKFIFNELNEFYEFNSAEEVPEVFPELARGGVKREKHRV